jgi:hypothetical protein
MTQLEPHATPLLLATLGLSDMVPTAPVIPASRLTIEQMKLVMAHVCHLELKLTCPSPKESHGTGVYVRVIPQLSGTQQPAPPSLHVK